MGYECGDNSGKNPADCIICYCSGDGMIITSIHEKNLCWKCFDHMIDDMSGTVANSIKNKIKFNSSCLGFPKITCWRCKKEKSIFVNTPMCNNHRPKPSWKYRISMLFKKKS